MMRAFFALLLCLASCNGLPAIEVCLEHEASGVKG